MFVFFISLAATYINMQSNLTFIRIVQLIIFKNSIYQFYFFKIQWDNPWIRTITVKYYPFLPHTPMLTKTFLSFRRYDYVIYIFTQPRSEATPSCNGEADFLSHKEATQTPLTLRGRKKIQYCALNAREFRNTGTNQDWNCNSQETEVQPA